MKTIIIDEIEYDLVPKTKTKLESVTYPEVEFIVSDNVMTWDEAVKWCEELDGKLPNIDELHVYRNQLCKHLGGKSNNYFWSASTRSSNTSPAWCVYLGYGDTHYTFKTASLSVVCFR